METPCLCPSEGHKRPSEGHKHGGRKVTETSATELIAIEPQNYCSRTPTH